MFGSLTDGLEHTKLVAAYDPRIDGWQELAESKTLGFQVWRAGSLFYLNPHFQRAGGGIYDPEVNRWRMLPDPPYHDLAGVIGHDEASYEYASGWVLDTRTGGWLEIEPRPEPSDVYDETIAIASEQRMVVFGGQAFVDGTLMAINDTWLWTPPPVIDSPR
jgi:hypothetical protein